MYLSGNDHFVKDYEKRNVKNPLEEKSDKSFEKEVEDNAYSWMSWNMQR